MSAGRSRRDDGIRLGARRARRHDQRDVRTDRDELHRRQLARVVAGEARVDGPSLSGPQHRGDRRRRPRGRRRTRSARSPSTASRPTASRTPSSSSSTSRTPRAPRGSSPATGAAPATSRKRDAEGYLWYQGRADDMFKAAGYRIGPSEIENCLVRHPAVANAAVVPSPDETRGNVVKAFIVLAAGQAPSAAIEDDIRRARAAPPRALRVPEGNRVHRRAADDHHRQGAAARAARTRARTEGGAIGNAGSLSARGQAEASALGGPVSTRRRSRNARCVSTQATAGTTVGRISAPN